MVKNRGSYVTYKSNLTIIIGEFDDQIRSNLELGVQIYMDAWFNLLAQKPTGRAYPRTKSGKMHIASAPFEPPAVDMGLLRASFMPKIPKAKKTVFGFTVSIGVGVQVTYATYLEYGTSRMAPRPLWRPAFEKSKREIYELLRPVRRI